jgi:hypothetical protein
MSALLQCSATPTIQNYCYYLPFLPLLLLSPCLLLHTSTATVAVTAATIPVATAVALERRRRDRKAAAFMGSASLHLAGEARGARGGRVCSVLDAGDIPYLCM